MAGRAPRRRRLVWPPFKATGAICRSAVAGWIRPIDQADRQRPSWSQWLVRGPAHWPMRMANGLRPARVRPGVQGRSIRNHVGLARCRFGKPMPPLPKVATSSEVFRRPESDSPLPAFAGFQAAGIQRQSRQNAGCNSSAAANERRGTRPRPPGAAQIPAHPAPGLRAILYWAPIWRRAVSQWPPIRRPGRTSRGPPDGGSRFTLACSRCWNPLPSVVLRSHPPEIAPFGGGVPGSPAFAAMQ